MTPDERAHLYDWIDAAAAMKHLGITSTSAFYRALAEHDMPYGRIGRHYRFRRIDLDQWVSVRKASSLTLQKAG